MLITIGVAEAAEAGTGTALAGTENATLLGIAAVDASDAGAKCVACAGVNTGDIDGDEGEDVVGTCQPPAARPSEQRA